MLLFLLFALAIYLFINAGFSAFAIICLSPLAILFVYAAFKWKMAVFWALIIVNWFIMNRNFSLPFPASLADESLELLLIAIAIIDTRNTPHFGRAWNFMFFAIMIWCGLCAIEILNDTCGLGMNVNAWFIGFSLDSFSIFIIHYQSQITDNILKSLGGIVIIFCILDMEND